jgi:NodT family efflux transporter outer membrane factor (OMF) lipoprotein
MRPEKISIPSHSATGGWFFFLFIAMLSTAMDSCTLRTPVSTSQPKLPADWKNAKSFPVASASLDLKRWWNHFDDPVLNQLIALGLKSNPDIRGAEERIKEARALRKAESVSLLPNVGASAGFGAGNTNGDPRSSSSAGLGASWEADLFGRRRSIIEAASANVAVAEENFHSVQAALASEIAIAYCNLRATETRLDVLHRNIKTREQTSQLASWRQQAGEADSLESSQALSSLEQARAAIPTLEQNAEQNRNLLARLSGGNPGSLDRLLASSRKIIPYPAGKLAVGIPADTLRQRPDVRIAGYQVLAAAANTRAADAARFPSLNLTGSLGINTLSAEKIFNPETTSANIIAGVTSPVFDAGRIRANIDANTAAEARAVAVYRSTVLNALSETEDALIACRRSTERLATIEKATVAAREANELAQQRYQSGNIDFIAALDAQRTVLGLEESFIATRLDRSIAFVQLYKALGGGWASH